MAEINYQTNDEKMNDFSAIPAGDYIAQIKNDEIKESKTGAKYLALSWEILDGQYAGRIIFDNLNLWHSKQQVQAIAQGAMNAICIAAGFPNGVKDSGELHRKAILLKVAVKTDKTYGDQNTIKKYSAYGNQSAPAQQSTEQPPGVKKQPWEK